MITVPMYALSLCLSDMKTICVYTTRVVCSKSQSFSTSWFVCPDPWDQSQVYLSTQCLHYKNGNEKFCQKVTVRSIQSSLINTSNRHNKLILDSILQVVKSPQSCHVDIIYIILVKLRDNENVQHSVELHIQFIICRYPIAHSDTKIIWWWQETRSSIQACQIIHTGAPLIKNTCSVLRSGKLKTNEYQMKIYNRLIIIPTERKTMNRRKIRIIKNWINDEKAQPESRKTTHGEQVKHDKASWNIRLNRKLYRIMSVKTKSVSVYLYHQIISQSELLRIQF